MKEIEQAEISNLAKEIAQLINERQFRALKQINTETIDLYWSIGKIICARQEAEGWGKAVVESLSNELMRLFPGAKGYSAVNLWRMRNFYLTYRDNEKLSPLVREISWSCNLVIMSKCNDDLQREFYLKAAARYGWTKRLLANYIEAGTYERFLTNQTNFEKTLPAERQAQAKLAVKDEYSFDFAELSPEYSEHELELQLMNPSIGIIICKSKDRTYVEYALRSSSAPIGVSTYNLSQTLPKELRDLLPPPEVIAERLAIFDE